MLSTPKKSSDINARLLEQEVEVQRREAAQRESQSTLQIKVLWGAISLQQLLLKNSQPDIQNSLQDAQPNYRALVAAVTAIVYNPGSPTFPDRVLTIQAANKPYLIIMNKIVLLLQTQVEARLIQLFIIEIIIDVLLFLIVVLASLFSDRIIKQIVQEAVKKRTCSLTFPIPSGARTAPDGMGNIIRFILFS